MNYSPSLLKAAREVVERQFPGRKEIGPIFAREFLFSLKQKAPEAQNMTPEQCIELFKRIRMDEQCDDVDPSQNDRREDIENVTFDSSELLTDDLREREFDEIVASGDEGSEEDEEDMSEQKWTWDEALKTVDETLNVYYPHRTLSAAMDFDRFRALLTEKNADIGSSVSDEDLKTLLLQAGATLIGSLKSREERESYLRRVGYAPVARDDERGDDSTKEERAIRRKGREEDSNDEDLDVRKLETNDERDLSNDVASEGNSERQVGVSRERSVDDWKTSQRDASDEYDYYRRDVNDPRDEENARRYQDRRESERYDYRDGDDFRRDGYSYRRYPRQSYGYDELRQGGYDGYGRYERPAPRNVYSDPVSERQNGYGSRRTIPNYDRDLDRYYDARVGRSRANDNRYAGGYGYEPYARVSATRQNADPFSSPEIRKLARDILDKYFIDRRVGSVAELKKFRYFLELQIPTLSLDDEKLRLLISYAGGVYSGPYVPTSSYFARSRRSGYDDYGADGPRRGRSDESRYSVGNYVGQPRLKSALEKARVVFKEHFADLTEWEPNDVAQFTKLFREKYPEVVISRDMLYQFLGDLLVEARDVRAKLDPTEEDVLLKIAQHVLKEHFLGETFKSDLSDFKRFRFQFELEAGPGASLSDEQLRSLFIQAGGVFEDVKEEPQIDEGAQRLTRVDVLKQVIYTEFPEGIDPSSSKEMNRFREVAKSLFKMDFYQETDSKLRLTFNRSLVPFNGRFRAVQDSFKELFKQRVLSLFKLGVRVVYFDAFLEKNSEWLEKANIKTVDVLCAFLCKYFPSYAFYKSFFEQQERDASERVKVESEIERVWGISETNTITALADRTFVPRERIEKALELNVFKFRKIDSETYERLSEQSLELDFSELDDQFDRVFSPELFEDADNDEEYASSERVIDAQPEASNALKTQETSLEREVEPQSSQTVFDFESVDESSENVEEEESEEGKSAEDESEEEEESVEEDGEEDYDKGDSEVDETSYDDSGNVLDEIPDASEAARAFIRSAVDSYLNEGGKIIYYKGLFERRQKELLELGVEDEGVMVKALFHMYPDYYFDNEYFGPTVDETIENQQYEVEMVKQEIDRVWADGAASRRIVEIMNLTYLTKEAIEKNLEKLLIEKRSNGYLVRAVQHKDGLQRRRRLIRRRGSKK